MSQRVGFPTRFKALDDQHDALIMRVRQLTRSMTDGGGTNFRTQVQQLVRLLRKHAAQEERAMEIHNYPELKLHKKYHEDLLGTLETILTFFDPQSMRVHKKAIAKHIQNKLSEEMLVDRLFAKFLAQTKNRG